LDGNFPKGLFVHRDHYEVDGPEGLAHLFRRFDNRKSSRTSEDVSGAYQGLIPELREVSKKVAKLGVEAINWYLRTIEGAPYGTGDDQYELFNKPAYYGFLQWLNLVFSIKTPEFQRRQVVSAMYATFIANETEARKFWDLVARGGEQFDDTAASTVLDNWLKRAKEGELELTPGELYQGCIFGWNGHREGKPIKDIKHDTKKAWYQPSE
jgi:hypothetical protein